MEKLYIVVRADLPPGAQIAQSCHALRAFVEKYPGLDRQWHDTGGNLVCLSIEDERELQSLLADAIYGDEIACAWFCEQDLGGQLTAIALDSRARRLVSNLPLALRARPLPKRARNANTESSSIVE